ncbi:thiamine pyrophosphate-binding protein [Methyloradius palustris]|uniref:Acetolactate synthase n=1 Tax=Methyloradius palustris TaxID=2778876 RepID=A0A8D5K113_9PROT|nr:thiamine pyrophosphate-binding protein [Methyloradius palustris]BCM25288.1 acetolactate synthase [Methyloradius palustris]
MKYSDQIANWLVKLGYTHCFYVGGGNIMHLIESLSKKLICIPVIHEVAAGIATEYFNETSNGNKALALITAGPGLTNIVTAIAGAFLESRELLVLGGQVKTADLARGRLRQRGIQEIDGISITSSITVNSTLLDAPVDFQSFQSLIKHEGLNRPGPVFLEIPIDIQARVVDYHAEDSKSTSKIPIINQDMVMDVASRMNDAQRPVLLIGGGVSRATASRLLRKLSILNIPILTTWNAADRVPFDQPNFMGRPNTWGQRSANLIIQQTDLLIAVGTRLGMQQTGFNWQKFIPIGQIVQIDIDTAELEKGHPKVDLALLGDANTFLEALLNQPLKDHLDWLSYARYIRSEIPLVEPINKTGPEYISPYVFAEKISKVCGDTDVIIPCSSGGAFTIMMQTFEQKSQQKIVTNKGLASMGYGLSGAIGAAVANPDSRVVLVEGDGGFSQNIQEIGTAAINQLNLKIFIFDDSGYASIRATQRNYFGGAYIGCDIATGLGLPNWEKLFAVWDVPALRLTSDFASDQQFQTLFESKGVIAFIVPIDPEQTYLPKITSRITEVGSMESNPLHLMTPDLPEEQYARVAKYLI